MERSKNTLTLMLLFIVSSIMAQNTTLSNFNSKAHKLAIQQDIEGLNEIKSKLDAIDKSSLSKKEQAYLNYLKAFVGYQPIFIEWGQVENAMDAISLSKRNLEKAIEMDPKLAEARLLKSLLTSGSLPPGKALEAVKGDLVELRKLDNGDIYADFATGMANSFTSDGGVDFFESSIKAMRQKGMAGDNWWYWGAVTYLADVYLGNFRRPEEFDKAVKLINHIKENQPDAGYLSNIDHFVTDHTSKALSKPPKVSWNQLATDASDDARDPQKMLGLEQGEFEIFDVKALYYSLDFSQGMIWFKFEYEKFPSENFGINIFFETDQDTDNGNLFMPYNRDFRYDIAGTLWLKKIGDKYIGVNGLAKGHDFARRRMVAKDEGSFDFYVDEGNKTLIVGVPHQYLDFPQSISVYATVGTNKNWEDNIPDKGGVSITQ